MGVSSTPATDVSKKRPTHSGLIVVLRQAQPYSEKKPGQIAQLYTC